MKRKLTSIIILFAMISVLILNSGQVNKYIAENDGVIDWQSYDEEKLI